MGGTCHLETFKIQQYLWIYPEVKALILWKKSSISWDGAKKNPVNNGITYQPQLVII